MRLAKSEEESTVEARTLNLKPEIEILLCAAELGTITAIRIGDMKLLAFNSIDLETTAEADPLLQQLTQLGLAIGRPTATTAYTARASHSLFLSFFLSSSSSSCLNFDESFRVSTCNADGRSCNAFEERMDLGLGRAGLGPPFLVCENYHSRLLAIFSFLCNEEAKPDFCYYSYNLCERRSRTQFCHSNCI